VSSAVAACQERLAVSAPGLAAVEPDPLAGGAIEAAIAYALEWLEPPAV
jgi:hypothetical protein